MQFRPCIDIHDGKVKQIVGSSISEADGKDNPVKENFVSQKDSVYYAKLYEKKGLTGGHVILLNKAGTPEYEKTLVEAKKALAAYPGGLQVGGGIDAQNAKEFLEAGASHVIVTSYVFSDGKINFEHLQELYARVGKEHLVLDLSCRYFEAEEGLAAGYYIMTDRWQNRTGVRLAVPLLEELSVYCSEFLIHAVDVEGKNSGIDEKLIANLAEWSPIPVTYAGGIHSLSDIETIARLGRGQINFTIGSALDLFGGSLSFTEIVEKTKEYL